MKTVCASLWQYEKHAEWQSEGGIGYLTRTYYFALFNIGYGMLPGFHLFATRWENEYGNTAFAESGFFYGLLASMILMLIDPRPVLIIPVTFIFFIVVNTAGLLLFSSQKRDFKMKKPKNEVQNDKRT